ncbi:ABC transporter ATP-binding protein [Staphylococcus equorum]|uniref:ABC transporter ATP-binding protein n=1 Tax=Staphylococcus equorum TaxID=246432 RepID=UPI00085345C8|nr:ABC transporter ATP-binding protein [Staphylococcus equorum]OEK78035.1 ABC transporter [Staphylococcus equorum]
MHLEVKAGNFHYKNKPYLYKEDVSFKLAPGEVLSILGPNGAGKTTLLKCVIGLLDWTDGETFINDVPLNDLKKKELWKKIGYVPQAQKMTFGYTLLELVIMGRAPFISTLAQPSKKDEAAAIEALETVGISHLANQSCNEVSGGELQLALIARTLVSGPELLILDEPESHLDIQKQITILQTIRKLSKEQGISCIINTHYPNHAFYLSDNVIITGKEKGIFFGETTEVMTEQRMKQFFDVDLKKLYYEDEELQLETMVPKDLGIPKNKT